MVSFVSRISLLVVGMMLSMASSFMIPTQQRFSSPTTTSLYMSEGVQKGTVKWFNTQKGFGFITPDDGSSDVFVHQTNIQAEGFRSLADGENVEFRTELDGNGRKKAVAVTGPDGADVQGAPFQAQQSNNYDRY